MATSVPLPTTSLAEVATPRPRIGAPGKSAPTGAWRYHAGGRSRPILVTAALVSAAIHASLLLGIGHAKKKPAARKEAPAIQLTITLPQLKELDEPEPVPRDDDGMRPDIGQPVPMQADVVSLPSPADFVQQFDFASLVERPDLSDLKLIALPENIRRPGKMMEGVKIFDPASLDRIPEAVFQPSPLYPTAMRREGLTVVVQVGFLVGADGRVSDVHIISSEHNEFNEAALVGVAKWKFRAGVKDGRKVITRMMVPITFRMVNALDLPN